MRLLIYEFVIITFFVLRKGKGLFIDRSSSLCVVSSRSVSLSVDKCVHSVFKQAVGVTQNSLNINFKRTKFGHFEIVLDSCHMEGRLFGRTETEKKQQETIKAKTLLACETERAKLKRCFRESWFGWCIEEHRQFWDCFLREREKHIIVSSQQGSTAPNSHWETSPDTKPDQTG